MRLRQVDNGIHSWSVVLCGSNNMIDIGRGERGRGMRDEGRGDGEYYCARWKIDEGTEFG